MLANVGEESPFQTLHHGEDEEGDHCGGQRQYPKPGANRHTDGRGDP